MILVFILTYAIIGCILFNSVMVFHPGCEPRIAVMLFSMGTITTLVCCAVSLCFEMKDE
jgi:hypothetical protein